MRESPRLVVRQGAKAMTRQRELPLEDERRIGAELLSLLLLLFGVFLCVAVFSYHGADPSFFTRSSEAVRNACGSAGAALAALLLNGVGVGAFLVPLGLLFLGVELHQSGGRARAWVTGGGAVAATLALTVFVSLQWERWEYGGASLLTGGMIGTWLAETLKAPLNPIGASIVSFGLFAAALVISTPIRVAKILSRALVWFARIGGRALAGIAALLGWASLRGAEASARGAHTLYRTAREKAMRARDERRRVVAEAPPAIPMGSGAEAATLDSEEEEEQEQEVLASVEDVEEEDAEDGPRIVKPRASEASAGKAPKPPRAPARRGDWKLPAIEFLRKPVKKEEKIDDQALHENARLIAEKLADFSIEGQVTRVTPGPVITLYEFLPQSTVKVSRITSLADDLAMALSAESVRILAPIPGKNVVGIEVPNLKREKVFLREFLEHADFSSEGFEIPIAMGKDFAGRPLFSDLAKMPHLLCAGQTGSGKSVFMNGLICSLLYRFTPDELRMILVDPKFVEFSAYQGMPHLLLPVVAEGKDASTALKWAVKEMQRRYRILQLMGVRKLADYNQKVEKLGVEATRDLLCVGLESDDPMAPVTADWMGCFDLDESGEPKIAKLPYIVIVIDELADLMTMAKKDVEMSITRIAQKARAAGIHLVIATQRPSTDVITGLIKANLPSRASFKLSSFIDSKTILDRAGAEKLLGQGDMLFCAPGASSPMRLQGAFLQDEEIQKIAAFLCEQGEPRYREEILVDEDEESGFGDDVEGEDEFFGRALELGKRKGQISTSMVQREFRLGYNRAARIVDRMEELGFVGPADGARPRLMLQR